MPNGLHPDSASLDPSDDDISWLEAALFARPGSVLAQTQPSWRPGRSSSVDELAWTALPVRGTTRRLVPTSRRFAAEAFRNRHDAMSDRRRQLGRLASRLVGTGILRIAPGVRARSHILFDDPEESVIAAAAAELDHEIRSCAITLGPQRYNRKPVVQLMDHDANTVAFLKVGVDPLTSAMVATEADAVERLRTANSLLEIPTVLWRANWHGRQVACFSPVGRQDELLPASQTRLERIAAAVIEAGGGRNDTVVRSTPPLERLRVIVDRAKHATEHELVTRG